MNILQQPVEIIIKQLSLLSHKDIKTLKLVCRKFKNICNEYTNMIYSNLITRDCGIVKPNLSTLYKFLHHYRDSYFIENQFNTFVCNIESIGDFIDMGFDINIQDNETGNSILMYVARYELPITFLKLLSLGASPHTCNNKGDTVLTYSIKYSNSTEMIYKILDQGVNINHSNNNGCSVLMYALKYAHTNVVYRLLKMNANVHAKDNEGDSVLMYALKYENINSICKILKMDVNVHHQNNFGETVLMCAIKYSLLDVVSILLDYNDIDYNIQDNDGYSVLMVAIINKMPLDIIKKITAKNNINVNIKNNTNNTALMYAILHSSYNIIEWILNTININLDIVNDDGYDVFRYAIEYCTPEMVLKILDFNPNLDVNVLQESLKYMDYYYNEQNTNDIIDGINAIPQTQI